MNREMDIAKFYGKIFEDTDLREKLKSEMKNVKTEGELKKLIEEEIIPIAQKMGEKFTVNDLIDFEKGSINKISIEDLENVGGGISLKPVILGGGLLALSLFGVKVNTADATIPTDVITNYNVPATEENGQQQEGAQGGNTNEQQNEQQIEESQGIAQPNEQQIEENQEIAQPNEQPIQDNIAESQEIAQQSEPFYKYILNGIYNYLQSWFSQDNIAENQGIAQTNEQQIEENQGIAQQSEPSYKYIWNLIYNYWQSWFSQDNIAESQEIAQQSEPSYKYIWNLIYNYWQSWFSQDNIEEYIMTALNPRDALAMNLSGATENFRFYNGDIKTIAVGENGGDGIPKLDYNKYSGEGSANLMTSLFPSSTGALNTESGYAKNHPFSEDCKPTPELVAGIVAYLHNHVRTEDTSQKVNFDKLINYYNNFKRIDSKKLEDKYKKLEDKYKKICKLYEENNGNLQKIFMDEKQKKIFNNSIKNIIGDKFKVEFNCAKDFNEFYDEFIENYNCLKSIEIDLNLIKNKNSLLTLLSVLKNAQYMIENQEQDDQHKDRILPQYTTERMIMCYCINHFHKKEDLDKFYTAVREKIHGDEKVSGKTKKHDKDMKDVLSKIKFAKNCPYGDKLAQNGPTKKIEKNGETFKFTNSTFEDCADITARHFLNLMGYNDADKWKYFLADADLKKIENNKTQILNAIDNNAQLPNLSLKEKLQAFMHYQSKVGADDTSLETRSFWNAVVSHMDSPQDGLYLIRYNDKKNGKIPGNEVDTGFVNMLKLTYNLLYDLGKECKDAKKAIDAMINTPNKDNLKTAMNEILKIFNPEAQIQGLNVEMSSTNNEIYGDLTVNSDGKEFPISQKTYHAYIDFDPLKFEWLIKKEQADFVKSDPIAQLLAKKFYESDKLKNVPEFNKYYGEIDGIVEKMESPQYANFRALKFLKTIAGEGNNIDRVENEINKYCKDANITILGNEQSISDFIFLNYALKSGAIKEFGGCTNNVIDDKLYELCKKNKLIGKDNNGNEYICVKNGDAVKVFPFWHGGDCPEDIVIPSTVNYDGQNVKVSGIVEGSFRGNKNIKTIKMSIDGNLCPNEFSDCTNLESVEILCNAGYLAVVQRTFENCQLLKNITISGAANIYIYCDAFKGCKSLTNVDISNVKGDVTISGKASADCENLKSFKISGAHYLYIGVGAFENCKLLTEVELSLVNGSVYIHTEAFENCKALKAFNILGEIKTLKIGDEFWGDEVFKDCEALEEFKVPKSVKELYIGKDVFKGCKNLKKIVIPDKFKNQKFNVPNGVEVVYY